MNNRLKRNSFIYLLIGIAVIAIFFTLFSDPGSSQEIPIDEVISLAKRGQVESIEIYGEKLTLVTTRGEIFTSRKEDGASIIEMLQNLSLIHI